MQHTGWSNTCCSSCEIAWRDEVKFPCGYLYCCSHWISKSMSGLHPYCHHWGVRLSMVHVLSASPFQINTMRKIRARSGRFKQANKCTHTLLQWSYSSVGCHHRLTRYISGLYKYLLFVYRWMMSYVGWWVWSATWRVHTILRAMGWMRGLIKLCSANFWSMWAKSREIGISTWMQFCSPSLKTRLHKDVSFSTGLW